MASTPRARRAAGRPSLVPRAAAAAVVLLAFAMALTNAYNFLSGNAARWIGGVHSSARSDAEIEQKTEEAALRELGRVERAILRLAGAPPDATKGTRGQGTWMSLMARHRRRNDTALDGADWGEHFSSALVHIAQRRGDVYVLPASSPLDARGEGEEKDAAAYAADAPSLPPADQALLRLNLLSHLLHFARGRLLVSAWLESVQRRSEYERIRRNASAMTATTEQLPENSATYDNTNDDDEQQEQEQGEGGPEAMMSASARAADSARAHYDKLLEPTAGEACHASEDAAEGTSATVSGLCHIPALADAFGCRPCYRLLYEHPRLRLETMEMHPVTYVRRKAELSTRSADAVSDSDYGGGDDEKTPIEASAAAAAAATKEDIAAPKDALALSNDRLGTGNVRCMTRLVAFASAGDNEPFVQLSVPGIAQLGDANVTVWRDFQAAMVLMVDGSESRTKEALVREGVTITTAFDDHVYIYGSANALGASGAAADLEVSVFKTIKTNDAKNIHGELAKTMFRPIYQQPDLPTD